jgi:hypothetical protein
VIEDDDEDQRLVDLYDKLFDINLKLAEDYTPTAVAGVLLAQAMRLYRTVLADEEFDEMVEIISDSADYVEPYELELEELERSEDNFKFVKTRKTIH